MAVNKLREKARRAFYVIRSNIKMEIPIRIWHKMAAKYGVPSLIMNLPNGTNIQSKYCMQSFEVQRKPPNN